MRAFQKIAVATDFGAPSEYALRAAAALARACSAELKLVHVVEPVAAPFPIALMPEPATLEAAAARELDAFADRAGDDVAAAERVVLRGRPADEIASFVDEGGIDLVVAGTHGRKALERWMLGSVAEKIVRSSRVPVLIVHDAPQPLRRILVATDFGTASTRAVHVAAALAAEHSATLTLLHVAVDVSSPYPVFTGAAVMPSHVAHGPQPGDIEAVAREKLSEVAEDLRHGAPQHETRVRTGRAWSEIVAEAEEGNYDLVVVGTHGRAGPSRWLLGSVAEKVVRSSRPPVLAVPLADSSS